MKITRVNIANIESVDTKVLMRFKIILKFKGF